MLKSLRYVDDWNLDRMILSVNNCVVIFKSGPSFVETLCKNFPRSQNELNLTIYYTLLHQISDKFLQEYVARPISNQMYSNVCVVLIKVLTGQLPDV